MIGDLRRIIDAGAVAGLSAPAAKLLLVLAVKFANRENGTAWPAIETLMQSTGMTERAVYRARSELVKTGLCERVAGGHRGLTATYRMTMKGCQERHPLEAERVTPPSPIQRERVTPASVKGDTGVRSKGDTGVTPNNPREQPKNNPSAHPRPPVTPRVPESPLADALHDGGRGVRSPDFRARVAAVLERHDCTPDDWLRWARKLGGTDPIAIAVQATLADGWQPPKPPPTYDAEAAAEVRREDAQRVADAKKQEAADRALLAGIDNDRLAEWAYETATPLQARQLDNGVDAADVPGLRGALAKRARRAIGREKRNGSRNCTGALHEDLTL